MQLVDDWLWGRNLRRTTGEVALDGESLTYAVVAYAVRRVEVPDDLVVLLAERCFGRLIAGSEVVH